MKVTRKDTMVVVSAMMAEVLVFLLYLVFGLSGQHQGVLQFF